MEIFSYIEQPKWNVTPLLDDFGGRVGICRYNSLKFSLELQHPKEKVNIYRYLYVHSLMSNIRVYCYKKSPYKEAYYLSIKISMKMNYLNQGYD